MRIAVAYENGQIFQHIGRTEQFKFYDVQDGTVKAAQVVSADGYTQKYVDAAYRITEEKT